MENPINQNPDVTPEQAEHNIYEHLHSAIDSSIESKDSCFFEDKNKDGKPYIKVYNLNVSILDVAFVQSMLSIAKPDSTPKAIYYNAQAPTVDYPKGSKANLFIGYPKTKDSKVVKAMFSNL